MRSWSPPLLVAGVLAFGLVATSHQAAAQAIVFDPSVFGQVLQEARQGLQQLQQLQEDGQILENQYQQLHAFYQSFAQLTNVSQLASLLESPSVMDPLPQVAQLESMLSGEGFTGDLGTLVGQFEQQNQVFDPSGTDWQAEEMRRDATITADQEALGNTLYNGASQRIEGTDQLNSALAISEDPKQTLDLIARANIENGIVQSQEVQAQSIAIMQRAQQEAERQRNEQEQRAEWSQVNQVTASAADTSIADDGP